MSNPCEPPRRIKTRRTVNAHIIEMDPASWAEMMTGLSIAIDHSDQEWAAKLRKLRSALSRG